MQPGMGGGGEKSSVVLVDAEGGIATVDDSEQRAEIVELIVRVGAENATSGNVQCELAPLVAEAVGPVMHALDRQQASILSVQAEKQPIEDDEGVVECSGQPVGCPLVVAKEAFSHKRDSGEYLPSQGLSDCDGLRSAPV